MTPTGLVSAPVLVLASVMERGDDRLDTGSAVEAVLLPRSIRATI